jgi:Xaa-Pro aminopeptidase
VAGIIGPSGFHVVAGLERGYVAEQLADRAGATVHKVELLQLADEKYPIRAERLEDVIKAAAGKDVDHIALLTPRQVVPAGIVESLQKIFGPESVVDAQELYFRVKYEKSEIEMRLIADACVIGDAMLRAMLAVLRPGRLETEVAAWGAWVGRMLCSERDGFQIMVGANTANRTLIGPALNREIKEGDWVHLGVAPKRDEGRSQSDDRKTGSLVKLRFFANHFGPRYFATVRWRPWVIVELCTIDHLLFF